MPYETTGAMKTIYISRCPINEGNGCGKGRSQLKRCDSMDDARHSVYNHIRYSPYHKEDMARAKEFMDKADIESFEEEVHEYVVTDESEASDFPPPAERDPSKKRRKRQHSNTSNSQVRRGDTSQPRRDNQAGHAIDGMNVQFAPRFAGAIAVALLPPSDDDDEKVTFRKSQLKLIHDCIVRAAHGARQAENIAERALAAFQSEAQNLERIATALGSALTRNA
jgi:hypothetical protein